MNMTRVVTSGSFDVLHPGHLNMLRQAKRYGDELIVIVARDETIQKVKGKKPLIAEKKRLKYVKKLPMVDNAVLGDFDDPYKVIAELNPDVFCVGYDQKAFVPDLKAEIRKRNLKTRVEKLKPYRDERYKSSFLKD
ncbi:FAD synthase [Candidatus Woesearchaeota archaeon]|nr:FAD synthase [Candidatus Woesearchaeota archaeon]